MSDSDPLPNGQGAAEQQNPTANQDGSPIVDLADILHGEREIVIMHGTERYRLRLTKNDKLILHK